MTVEELNVKVTADISDLKRDLARMEGAVKGSAKKSETAMSAGMKRIGGAVAAAFSVQAIIGFSRAVIEVRSEFEKFEAVLANTLGSRGAARQILSNIKEMAAETPFSVAELSGAFVKLTNYGLKPSMESMRQYGDLASSVGKGFDQLAEAVADATTGEFERLKEFGIKTKKEGDKVTFTFKEQATTVDFTSKSIENYVKGLGNLEGVSGSMAAISATLGGKVSNLGDSWDSLLNTIGETGPWQDAISGINGAVQALDKALTRMDTPELTLARRITAAAQEGMLEASEMALFTNVDEMILESGKLVLTTRELEKMFLDNGKNFQDALAIFEESLDAYDEYVKGIVEGDSNGGSQQAKEDEERARRKLTSQLLLEGRARARISPIGTFNLRLREQMSEMREGFVKPTITGPEIQYEDTSNLVLSQLQERTFEADEAMFDFGSSASILSQSLVAAAHDTENASDIFANAIGAIVSELLTQALATKMGSFAGPLGGLVGGFLTLGLKGADMETSRVRTQNSTARFN